MLILKLIFQSTYYLHFQKGCFELQKVRTITPHYAGWHPSWQGGEYFVACQTLGETGQGSSLCGSADISPWSQQKRKKKEKKEDADPEVDISINLLLAFSKGLFWNFNKCALSPRIMRDDIHPDRVVSMLWPARRGRRLAREVLCVVQRTLALGVSKVGWITEGELTLGACMRTRWDVIFVQVGGIKHPYQIVSTVVHELAHQLVYRSGHVDECDDPHRHKANDSASHQSRSG